MTDLPPRRRGRPTKEEAAAREAAAQAAAQKDEEESAFLDELLSAPVKPRKTILQPDENTLRTLSEIAKLFGTQEEAAAILGVSRRTLTSFLNAHEMARDAWDDGIQRAKVSLRRKQFALADRNAPAAIFLGKNYLGQKDENHTNLNVKTEVGQMTEEQLMEIASRAPAPPRTPPKKESVH
jgi:hypothetical protein